MDIAKVEQRFMMLSGVSWKELARYRVLLGDARDYITAHCVVDSPDAGQTKRLERLCAAYAFLLYELCTSEGFGSFAAGDVKITSDGTRELRSERIWRALLAQSGDLVNTGDFMFGRIEI